MTSTRSGVVSPVRGEIWEVEPQPAVGREQAGHRPALIVSDNALNSGPRGLVIVIPVTVRPGGCRPISRSFLPKGD